MDAIEQHQQAMISAFAEVLKAEDAVSVAKAKLDEATTTLGREVNGATTRLEQAWAEIQKLMAETGEPEVILPGQVTDYKIGWSTPRETVKVESPDAVPDEFCKMERKPKLREIGEHLKVIREQGGTFPNWGRFELGSSKLTWKAVKKHAA